MEIGMKFKPLEFTGNIKIKFYKGTPDDSLFTKFWMPAKVIADYEKFFIVEILPHLNPYRNFGKSKPYRMGINKTRLYFGEVKIKEA